MNIKFLAIFIFLFSTAIAAAAQTKTPFVEPRTVTDFYLQLPSDFVNDSEGSAERRKRIVIEDIANGYLKLKPTEEQDARGYTEIALFKKSAGGYVVGVASIECPDACPGNITYLERRADRWVNVTSRVYPLTQDGELVLYNRRKTAAHKDYESTQTFWTVHRLPRNGRVIHTDYTGEGKEKKFEIFAATWNGERFVPNEALPKNLKLPVVPSDAVLSAAEAAWKPFLTELQAAVKKRDRRKLRLMMSEDFSYNCCDEPYPDHRTGAFTIWDGVQQKDYQGWKNLERELRTAPFYETSNEAAPMRFLDSAGFVFKDNRWYFVAFGADEM